MKPAEILERWKQRIPKDGAVCKDALDVMRHLGFQVEQSPSGHWKGSHPQLIGSEPFPQGVLVINCHAFGIQGRVHPAAIRDIVRAARIIEGPDDE